MMAPRRSGILIGAWLLLLYSGCSEINDKHPQMVVERCEVCHEMPPNDSLSEDMVHFNHVFNKELARNMQCYQCHLNCDTISAMVNDTLRPVMIWTLDTLHRNGRHELYRDAAQCMYCHDYQNCDGCHGSPPNDAQNPPSQRVHMVHVARQGYACDSCHKGYDPVLKRFPVNRKNGTVSSLHNDGDTNVVFGVTMFPGKPQPFFGMAEKRCNNLYCHGSTLVGGRPWVSITDVKPTDSTGCGFCHHLDSLLLNGRIHSKESHADLFPDCLNCHEGYRLKTLTTNDSTHRNGMVDTIPGIKCDECHSEPHVVFP